MGINHRWGSRIPLVFEVEIKHMGKKLATSCTRNINPYGAFIELSTDILKADDFVEVRFLDRQKKDAYILQKGLIKHHGKEGVGLLFAYDSLEFRTMLGNEMANINSSKVLSS